MARKEAARSCVAHGAAWEEDGDGERDLGAAVNGLVCHGISGEKKIKLTTGHWMHVRWRATEGSEESFAIRL